MSLPESVNDYVRQRMRRIRRDQGISVSDMARRVGMPVSSYSCLESGVYRIHLDNLFGILNVLDVGIADVWPVENTAPATTQGQAYLERVQAFRLAEVVNLSGAEGAALFRAHPSGVRVLLYQNLSDFLLDRLCLYLADGTAYRDGVWFQKRAGKAMFHCFLKAESCPTHLGKVIEDYLAIWVSVYE